MSDQFGTIFVSANFDDAVGQFLAKWIDTYLSKIEREVGVPARSYPRPKSWNFVFDEDSDKWPEDNLPSVMIASAGFDGTPERLGEGHYAGWWSWTVIAFVTGKARQGGNQFDATRRAAQVYGPAIRSAVVQHQTLEGAVGATDLVSESYGYARDERSHTLGVAAIEFRSYIETVVEESEGPLEPDEPEVDPTFPDWPTVSSVDIDLQQLPIDDD